MESLQEKDGRIYEYTAAANPSLVESFPPLIIPLFPPGLFFSSDYDSD
jgi:hypothetical protein